MTAFGAAIDLLFADPHLAVDAIWTPVAGPSVAVRVIRSAPDLETRFGDARVIGATTMLDVRVSEMAAPAKGDVIRIDGVDHQVQGTPRRDAERLIWTVEARPLP
jgi:hypothetical protein